MKRDKLYETVRFVKSCRKIGCRIFCHPARGLSSKIIGINEQHGYLVQTVIPGDLCSQTGIPPLLHATPSEIELVELEKSNWRIVYRDQIVRFIESLGKATVIIGDYALPAYWPRLVAVICRYIRRCPGDTNIAVSLYAAEQAAMIELSHRKTPTRYLIMRCKPVIQLAHGEEDKNILARKVQVALADERLAH